jgi:hypothetical protein
MEVPNNSVHNCPAYNKRTAIDARSSLARPNVSVPQSFHARKEQPFSGTECHLRGEKEETKAAKETCLTADTLQCRQS